MKVEMEMKSCEDQGIKAYRFTWMLRGQQCLIHQTLVVQHGGGSAGLGPRFVISKHTSAPWMGTVVESSTGEEDAGQPCWNHSKVPNTTSVHGIMACNPTGHW